MPKLRNPKEIKQFLDLCGYYRKFVPCFADILRPLAKLTGQGVKWDWCTKCDPFLSVDEGFPDFSTYLEISRHF